MGDIQAVRTTRYPASSQYRCIAFAVDEAINEPYLVSAKILSTRAKFLNDAKQYEHPSGFIVYIVPNSSDKDISALHLYVNYLNSGVLVSKIRDPNEDSLKRITASGTYFAEHRFLVPTSKMKTSKT